MNTTMRQRIFNLRLDLGLKYKQHIGGLYGLVNDTGAVRNTFGSSLRLLNVHSKKDSIYRKGIDGRSGGTI